MPRAPCNTHSSRPLHNATLGNSRGRPGPLGSGPAPWRSCLASRPCKQRCTYVSTCCTKPALAFAWPDRVSFMRGSSFRFQIRVFRIILPVSCFDNPLPYFLESMPSRSPWLLKNQAHHNLFMLLYNEEAKLISRGDKTY